MFEAVHGSAPMIAGQGIANPSGLLQGAVLMLVHLGKTKVAEQIQNAWLSTIEAGIHTADIYTEGLSRQKLVRLILPRRSLPAWGSNRSSSSLLDMRGPTIAA